ncbi:MAG: hypothetical protein Q8L10_05500 [Candidatus Moranbacteria bacterium]|nr:hypothetical protein [Candidatus Moranbacteria bacterium]
MLLLLKDKKQSVSGTEKTLRLLQEKLTLKGISSMVASFEDVRIAAEKDSVKISVKGVPFTDFSTVYFRRVGENRNLAFILSSVAEKNGIRFIDRLYKETNEPSKLKQTCFLALNGISVPKTFFSLVYDDSTLEEAIGFLGLPIVIKFSRSKKGSGIFLAESVSGLKQILQENPSPEIILQTYIPNDFDYRVFILGNSVACVEKRTRTNKTDFRNNVSLGATEEFLALETVPEQIKKCALEAAEISNIQVAGADIVVGPDGTPYVFEVNRSPAITYDESISDEMNLLANYLEQCEIEKK